MNKGIKLSVLLFFYLFFVGTSYCAETFEQFLNIVNTQFNTVDDVINAVSFKSVADVNQRVVWSCERAKEKINEIINLEKEDRTFDNTVRAFDLAKMESDIIAHSLEAFSYVCPDKEVRDACSDAKTKLEQFAVDEFSVNINLYEAISEYNNVKQEKLTPEEKYFLKKIIKDFERNGLNLSPEKLDKVRELKKDIVALSTKYEENISDDKSHLLVDRSELAGLQDHFIDNLEKEDDKFVLGCDYPTYFEVIQNCKVRQTRKRLSKLFSRRAYPVNEGILKEAIAKRNELAKLLGFKSYAELDLDDQMAKTPKKAYRFLNNLVAKAQKKEREEFETLRSRAASRDQDERGDGLPEGVTLTEDGKFYPWDYFFVEEQYKKKNFDVDENEIAEYFPVQKTIDGIFDIYQQFLGLEFREIENGRLWHEDVKFIEIHDKKSKKLLGYLFLDLYPRDNKFSHACMCNLVPSMWRKNLKTGEYESVPSVILVIANFPKATKDRPALLKHSDVKTFFHEFGHAMHGLLGKTKIASFSGVNVKSDFVEVPSQMFEEWMWDKGILKRISSHYKTGDSLPDELIDKKIELKKLTTGFFVDRLCWFALMSLDYFGPGAEKDLEQLKKQAYNKSIKTVAFDEADKKQACFGHLMDPYYGAKYYGYIWSKVFALDLFDQIKKAGLLSNIEGRKLIDDILSKGGSVEPDKLLVKFLGREPNQKAFLKDLGL